MHDKGDDGFVHHSFSPWSTLCSLNNDSMATTTNHIEGLVENLITTPLAKWSNKAMLYITLST